MSLTQTQKPTRASIYSAIAPRETLKSQGLLSPPQPDLEQQQEEDVHPEENQCNSPHYKTNEIMVTHPKKKERHTEVKHSDK